MYTLADLPRHGAALHGPRPAVVFEGTTLTYAQLNERVNRAAHGLLALGLQPGERIAILADNSCRYLEVYLAAAKVGVSVTPLNTRLSDEELDFIVRDSEAVAVVAGDGYEERAGALLSGAPAAQLGLALDNAFEGFVSYGAAVADASGEEPDPERFKVAGGDVAVLMYTGGTTGTPKGVMLSHRNVMTAAIATCLQAELTKDDATCFVLPIFHVSWWPIISLLLVGGKVVIVRRPDLVEMLRLIQEERCTHLNLVPTLYAALINQAPIGEYDLSSLRLLTYAGSPFPLEVLKQAISVFGPRFVQGYGATETAGGPITMLAAEDHHLEGPDTALLGSAREGGHLLGSQGGRRARSARRSRRDRRGMRPGRARDARLLEEPGAHLESPPRWVVPHGRPRLPRRTGLPVPHGPQIRHDHHRRRERVPERGGERPLHAPCRTGVFRGGDAR